MILAAASGNLHWAELFDLCDVCHNVYELIVKTKGVMVCIYHNSFFKITKTENVDNDHVFHYNKLNGKS